MNKEQRKTDIVIRDNDLNRLKTLNYYRYILFSLERSIHNNRYAIFKHLMEEFKYDLSHKNINKLFKFSYIMNRFIFVKHILDTKIDILDKQFIFDCINFSSCNDNVKILKYTLKRWHYKETDSSFLYDMLDFANPYLVKKPKYIKIIKSYIYIIENNIYVSKYKNSLILG